MPCARVIDIGFLELHSKDKMLIKLDFANYEYKHENANDSLTQSKFTLHFDIFMFEFNY